MLPGTSAAPLRQSARAFLAALALAACAPAFTHAAELDKDDPAAELASFRLPPGFEANLFASEKDGVVKPIQMRWDTRGRLWVIQSTTYPQLVPGETPNDKVLILEDPERTGHVQKVTVFADGLMIPTGLEIAPVDLSGRVGVPPAVPGIPPGTSNGADASIPSHAPATSDGPGRMPAPAGETPTLPGKNHSACYVGEGTKLWLLTDTDGDGVCDKREVVLRGFGTGDNHQNINSFRWSPGGELMFSQGLHAHSRVETPHGIVALDEAGFFRYRPREQRLEAFYGGQSEPQNPWGFAFTDWGQMLMVAGNNGGIYWPLPEMVRGVQKGRRDQLWENARGRKCSGPDIIGTAHLPPEWQGVMLTGGYINNAVWALKIEDERAGFKISDFRFQISDLGKSGDADSSKSEIRNQKSEISPPGYFVQSSHPSFRPVDVKLGPDGAIYLCDWYNPIIGHYQASFRHPDRDKAHGRIWRITYKGRTLVTPPPIAGASVAQLFVNLKSGERWVREQSKRELAGRPTEQVLTFMLGQWPLPEFATDWFQKLTDRELMDVLSVFEAHDTPVPGILKILCESKEPNARAYAAGVIARWAGRGNQVPTLNPRLEHDDSPRVRLAVIVAAGNIPNIESITTVAEAVSFPYSREMPPDKFITLAARSAAAALKPLAEGSPELMAMIAAFEKPVPTAPPPMKSPGVALSPTPAATGKLRATPEFVAELVKEVRASGEARHGAEVFRRAELACTACHSLEDKGGKVGPPLDAIGSGQPLDFIIGTVLEPQREIKESYEAVELSAKDGRKLTGYIVARDATGVTLREPATGAETKLAPADVAAERAIGSFMPAGLVDGLSRADLRDLFRYLSELGKPK